MEIEGIIISGTKKGSYFVSQKFYSDQFKDRLGFKPFAGTLNIQLPREYLKEINRITEGKMEIIKGKEGFGDVKFIKAILDNQINGALVFPVKTQHTHDILEFIASENLRENLHLKDGDLVTLKIKLSPDI